MNDITIEVETMHTDDEPKFVGYVYRGEKVVDHTSPSDTFDEADRGARVLSENLPEIEE